VRRCIGCVHCKLLHLARTCLNHCFLSVQVRIFVTTLVMSLQQILKPVQFLAIWDLGGQRKFMNMLPLVCNDVVAILFMFDLSRKSVLNAVKEWYHQVWGFNKVRCSLIYHGPLKLNCNTIFICRPRDHFLLAPSLIHLRRSHAMNKRRSQNRPSALPRRYAHLIF
jgi:GTPase SAR1 family protein